MGRLLTGKEVSARITEDLIARIEILRGKGVEPCLGILRVGENPSDLSYERGATKRAEKVGVTLKKVVLPEDASREQVLEAIDQLNGDEKVHGILAFRPMPKHIDDKAVRDAIAPEKDMDGVTDASLAGVFTGTDLGYPPCTARACMELLDYYGIELKGKKAAVVGRSLVIGRPVAMMLMGKHATVTICHTRTKKEDLQEICSGADILVAAAGVAKNVTRDLTNEKQIVIDVGINVDENGKLCGDADFENIADHVEAITPVPGGVGAVTTGVLMKHVVEAAEKTV